MNYCQDSIISYYVVRRADGSAGLTNPEHYCLGTVNMKFNYSTGDELAPATTICLAFGGVTKSLDKGEKVHGDLHTYTVRFDDSEIQGESDIFYAMIKHLRGNSSMWITGQGAYGIDYLKNITGTVTDFFDIRRITGNKESPASGGGSEQGEQPDLTYLLKPASYWIKVNNNEKSEWININLGSPITFSDLSDQQLSDSPDMKKFSKDVFDTSTDSSINIINFKHDNLKSQKIKFTVKSKVYVDTSKS